MTDRKDDLSFVDCSAAGTAMLDRLYAEVLKPAFPPAELISPAEMETSYGRPNARFPGMIAGTAAGPVGAALGEFSAASNILLLCYLAVRADLRSRGIGADLLARALSRWRAELRPTAILAEIEDPRRHPPSSFGDPKARARWYDRFGAGFLPLSHFQPALQPGLSRASGLLLISLDRDAQSVPVDALTLFLDEYIESYEGPAAREGDENYLALRAETVAWGDAVPVRPISRLDDWLRSD
ncbi:N-acetyltransferase [Actinomadura rayongensis]|uniref:N-acetyltransferase n=1 Tax=Actinomadura rayongensis TaxID=1429076 RepID=A0A6I4WIH8_9ACTN|nr:N-acetyltransferase [Actinomadura rayongensis]